MKKILLLILALAFLGCSKNDDDNPSSTTVLYSKWHQINTGYRSQIYPYENFGDCADDYMEFYDVDKVRLIHFIDCEEESIWQGTFEKSEDSLMLSVGNQNRQVRYTVTENALILKYEDDWEDDGQSDVVTETYQKQ